jgi:hypothetical protein
VIANGFTEALRFILSKDYARAELGREEQDSLEQRAGLGLMPLVPILRGQREFAWPWDGNAVVAAHAVQVFPPVPQEYSAYTTSLDELDARFFSSTARPTLGLISVEELDGHLPLQTAGMSFVQLLSCYRPVALSGAFLVVASTSQQDGCPRDMSPGLQWTARQSIHLGEWVRIPSDPGYITIAQMNPELSNLGKLMNLSFRISPLRMGMRMHDGRIETFRLVHNTLRDGVMVSTILSDTFSLGRLWLGTPDNNVDAISLQTDLSREWRSVFDIRFLKIPARVDEPSVVTMFRTPARQDQVAADDLRGHIDSAKPRQGDWMLVEGWYDSGPGQVSDQSLRLAVLRFPDKALLVPSFKTSRPDVVQALGPNTTPMSGFAALVPRALWGLTRTLAVLRSENGHYRIIGILKQ